MANFFFAYMLLATKQLQDDLELFHLFTSKAATKTLKLPHKRIEVIGV